jgi:hypothetical protein
MAGNAGHANIIPPQPGEVRNPSGINQYTYRKDAEATFERLLRSVADRGEMTVAEAILTDLVEMGQGKDKWAIDRVLERILPAVTKHEVDLPGADPAALAARLAPSTSRSRTNGEDRSDAPAGKAGA